MNALRRASRAPSDGMRRAVVLMPNGFTLFNLFCGIYAIILAMRGDFAARAGFIVLGGIADTLDGRVARATGTGSRFGEELDSLVDAISFGFAPALIMYLGCPNRGTWEWLLVFIFTSCAVMRLARFNVEQAGRKKTHFHGLPSPAAGLTLATYYWFSSDAAVQPDRHSLHRQQDAGGSSLAHDLARPDGDARRADDQRRSVSRGSVDRVQHDSRKVLGTLVVAVAPSCCSSSADTEFIFPALLAYVLYGAIKWVILGFLGRSSTPDEVFLERRSRTDRPATTTIERAVPPRDRSQPTRKPASRS